jgi:NosR/NirI family nitrous oxide reductase transcriptional regulator
MVMYYDDHACPPLVMERKKRERSGQPLSAIDGNGYFIPLEVVRKDLADKNAQPAKKVAS